MKTPLVVVKGSERSAPDLSIIIVNWNTRELLAACLGSIAATQGDLHVETVVVDNGSDDGSADMVRERFAPVRLIANADNRGFARGSNQGAAEATGRHVVFLNSDAQLRPQALQKLLALADSQPRAGVVGAQLRNVDGSFQFSHAPFPDLWREFLVLSVLGRLCFGRWYPSRGPHGGTIPRTVDWVSGACLLARREALDDVHGFDEGFVFYGEEVDLCYTMRSRGWEVWYEPAAEVVHLGGGSSQMGPQEHEGDLYRGRVRFFRKHYGPRAARLFKLEVYLITALKIPLLKTLHLATGGRVGRPVMSMRELALALRGF